MFYVGLRCVLWVTFYSIDSLTDCIVFSYLFTCIAASLFNKLTYLLTPIATNSTFPLTRSLKVKVLSLTTLYTNEECQHRGSWV